MRFIDNDNQIAVITAEGAIMKGDISQGVAGAKGIVKQIRSGLMRIKIQKLLFLE